MVPPEGMEEGDGDKRLLVNKEKLLILRFVAMVLRTKSSN